MRIVKGIMRAQEEKRTGIIKHVFSAIKYRLPGGVLFKNIASDILRKARFSRLMYDVFVYFAGGKTANCLFSKMSVEKTGEYTEGGFLYHLIPVKSIDEIKQNGIVSNKNYVFLTDDIDYFTTVNGYPDWKATTLKENTDFYALKINVSSLKKLHKVYCIDREHEFVTDKIEPEFIIFE